MFAEKLDALMNIAEVTNSQLGRSVNINPSHIGRLRSGARPLPKKHEYLPSICQYIADHIRKEYQVNALQKLTDIGHTALGSSDSMALYLNRWLLDQEHDTTAATGRLISGFSHISAKSAGTLPDVKVSGPKIKYSEYLYGNAGKRKAVEQFFMMILQEEKPQTLLLFSDENMAWLYEDSAFAAKWAELFKMVIMKGNRVKIIHTVSRDMNEMLEAVNKWIPIYMTGMIEPYYYPRLRDGLFQRTLFIAPKTAAIVSSSVQQDTDGMLNMFVTDKAALDALVSEYEHYFSLCRPLMRILTMKDADMLQNISLIDTEEDSYLCLAMPPLFTMPEKIIRQMAEQTGNSELSIQWKQDFASFEKYIKKQHLTLVLPDPEYVLLHPDSLYSSSWKLFSDSDLKYTEDQYRTNIEHLRQMKRQYENLNVCFVKESPDNTVLYVKENTGVIMAKTNSPQTAFVINEKNMVSAFWDYLKITVES